MINLKINKLIVVMSVIYGFVFLSYSDNVVIGIEIRSDFSDIQKLAVSTNLSSTVPGYVIIDTNYGKHKVKLSDFINDSAEITCYPDLVINYSQGEEKKTIEKINFTNSGKGYKYAGHNYYGDKLPEKITVELLYDAGWGFSSLFGSGHTNLVLAQLSSPKNDSMHFIDLRFKNGNSGAMIMPPKQLSDINSDYITNSFINNYETSRWVKVIAPNNPHFKEYSSYLNASQNTNVVIQGYELMNWDEIADELEVDSGVSLMVFNEDNYVDINDFSLSYDNDNDKIPSYVELYNTFTNPINPDSDNDELNDYPEVFGTNITLKLSSGDVIKHIQTCPIWHDTDSDGISDGQEVYAKFPYVENGITNFYTTDPTSPDTDNDGLTDKFDPHPLSSCFMPGSSNLSEDWISYWQNIAFLAGQNINRLNEPLADSDGDGVCNLNEMLGKSNPIFSNGFRKVVFEPRILELGIIDNVITASFSATFFASHSITGKIHMSKLDLNPRLMMDDLSVLWPSFLPKKNDEIALTFISDNFQKKDFVLIIDGRSINNAITQTWIKVTDQFGEYRDKLSVVFNSNISNLAPSTPELIFPEDNDVLMINSSNDFLSISFTNTYDFAWTESIDPEGSAVNYILKLFFNNFVDTVSFTNSSPSTSLLIVDYFTQAGDYYWQVIAFDDNGNTRSSDIKKFYVSIFVDSDNDGYYDDYELRNGSDPNNADSVPLTIDLDVRLPDGYVDRDYYLLLKAKGGSQRPFFWTLEKNSSTPAGLSLKANGELRGIPTKAGDYLMKISVFDGVKFETKELSITINPKRAGLGVEAGKGEL
jgi:hypothetical protein